MTKQEINEFINALRSWMESKSWKNFKELYKVCAMEWEHRPWVKIYYIVADTWFNGKYKETLQYYEKTIDKL